MTVVNRHTKETVARSNNVFIRVWRNGRIILRSVGSEVKIE